MITYSTLCFMNNCIRSKTFLAPAFVRLCSSQLPNVEIRGNSESPPLQDETQKWKYLKVAIIGSPNSGKSTLINQIVERRVSQILYSPFKTS